jgi:hypothetical protein
MSAPFLYHAQVIADAFSASSSMSEKMPAPQVRVSVLAGVDGKMNGCPRDGALSG